MSKDIGIPYAPYKAFEAAPRPYGARFSTQTHMRELEVSSTSDAFAVTFTSTEMQLMSAPSLYYSAYDADGAIEIERIAAMGLTHNIIFKRRAGLGAKLRAYWQNVEVYYN